MTNLLSLKTVFDRRSGVRARDRVAAIRRDSVHTLRRKAEGLRREAALAEMLADTIEAKLGPHDKG